MTGPSSEKRCFKCGHVKSLDEFYRHPQMADGRLNKCKECAKNDVKLNYKGDPDAHREYELQRSRRPERRAKQREYNRATRLRSPEKTKARIATSNAIRDGKLKMKPCEVCGSLRVQAHHEDYSKPLDVRWLCFIHHRQAHGQSPPSTPDQHPRRLERRVPVNDSSAETA